MSVMPDSELQWIPRSRNYSQEKLQYGMARNTTANHPLNAPLPKSKSGFGSKTAANPASNGVHKSSSRSSVSSVDIRDLPLSTAHFVDPLSMMANDSVDFSSSKISKGTLMPALKFRKFVFVVGILFSDSSKNLMKEQLFGPWAAKKETILSRFTTTEKLTLSSSYLSGEDRVSLASSSQVSGRIQVL